MEVIQFCLDALSTFVPSSEEGEDQSSTLQIVNASPKQIFAIAHQVLAFQHQQQQYKDDNAQDSDQHLFSILEDLASVVSDDDDTPLKTIRLALVIDIIEFFGHKDVTSERDNQKIEVAFKSLEPMFAEATKEIASCSSLNAPSEEKASSSANNSSRHHQRQQQKVFFAQFASICIARLVVLGRVDLAPFLLTLASASTDDDDDDNVDGDDGTNSNNNNINSFRLALDIVSQVAQLLSAPKANSSRLADEILTVVLASMTRSIQLDANRVKELSRRVLHPILASTPALRASRKDDLKQAVQVLASYPNRQSEAVMLIASLFEVLIDHNVGRPTGDLRSEKFLWDLILSCLNRVSGFNEDASIKTNIHNQAIYLLKRIVSSTGGKDINIQVSSLTETVNNQQSQQQPKKGNNKADQTKAASVTSYVPPTLAKETFDAEGRFFWGITSSTINNNKNSSSSKQQQQQQQQQDLYFTHWSQFFVVFETLNEYSTHLCEPATQSLKQLWNGGFIHPCFIESALFKAMTHPNVGVRRLALSLLWSLDVSKVAEDLSIDFLAKTVLVSSGDPRLCQEVDRSVIFSNSSANSISLLGGFEASETVGNEPAILATVVRLSHFFCSLLTSTPTFLTSVEKTRAFLSKMIAAVSSSATTCNTSLSNDSPTATTSHFCLAVFCRVFRDVAHSLRASSAGGKNILSPELCSELSKLLNDSVHSRRPTWLEARFVALICEAAVTLPRSESQGADETDRALMQLLCVAGPLAEAGGKSQAPVDSVGVVLPIGSSLPLPLIRQLMIDNCVFSSANRTTAEEIKEFINHNNNNNNNSATLVTLLDVTKIKQRCFQVYDIVPAVVSACEVLSTLSQRTMISPIVVARAATVFAEFSSYDSPEVAELFLMNNMNIRDQKIHQVCSCANLIANLTNYASRILFESLEKLSSSSSSSLAATDNLMISMQTDSWDAICAALFWSMKFGISGLVDQQQKKTNVEPIDFSSVWATCEKLLLLLSQKLAQMKQNQQVLQSVLQFKMIVERNILRFVQAAAASVAAGTTAAKNSSNSQNTIVEPEIALRLARLLCDKITPLRTSVDALCELSSGLSWGTICAQHYRATWSACLVFITSSGIHKNNKDPALLLEFGQRFLDELDCAAVNNLSCIFDLIGFVLMNLSPPSTSNDHDHREFALRAAKSMRNRIVDAYRKERIRCAPTFVFAVCRCQAFGNEDLLEFIAPLLREGEEASQRIPYIVAQAVAERANNFTNNNNNPSNNNWIATRELLLHVAIYLNTIINDTDETEACYACLESVINNTFSSSSASSSSWSVLTQAYPPTSRLVALARASAISSLHFHASQNPASAEWIISTLLDWSENKLDVAGKDANTTCMVNSTTFRNRFRVWQTLTSLASFIPSERWNEMMHRVLKKSLAAVNPTSIRRVIEGFAFAGLCINAKETIPVLIEVSENLDARPFLVSSYLQLTAMLLINNSSGIRDEMHKNHLLTFLVRYCSSHQHLLRLVSGLALGDLVLDDQNQQHGNNNNTSKLIDSSSPFHPKNNPTVHYVTTHPECVKFRDRYKEVTGFRSILWKDMNLTFCVQKQDGQQWLHDSMPAVFFQRIRRCEDEFRSFFSSLCVFDFYRGAVLGRPVDLMWNQITMNSSNNNNNKNNNSIINSSTNSNNILDLYLDYSEIILAMQNSNAVSSNFVEENVPESAVAKNVVTNLQRKTVPWWQSSVHNSNELISRSPNVLQQRERQNLIIVASLLDNPVNIAGLFRCAEIFAAEKIIIPDKKVLSHPHFVAAARSAELWFPYEAVAEANLPEFFKSQKEKGYTICGVEQTADSVSIQDYPFPAKSVLVLGSEGQGMPASLLPFMDVCVEIPQFGLIRSLNVHTTGSIVIYEFTKQHKLKEKTK